jgi:hypothetical protein
MRTRRLSVVLVALVLGAAGLVLVPALPATAAAAALASVAPATEPVTINGAADCPSSYVCFWSDPQFKGRMGKLAGNNPTWSVFPQPDCGRTRNWEDCASSTFNNGNRCSVNLYKDPDYRGTYLWEQRGSLRYDLNHDKDQHGLSFNDTISSNKWCL